MRAFLALAVLVPVRLAAQQGAEDRTGARLRVVTATVSISLDGRLDGAAWAGADSITEFRQREPSAGAPASERTVVKVLRDAAALYVAVRAYDGDMRRVRASELRRDADLSSDDNVQLLIDSFHDRRGAFVFGTNPNGAMWDAQLVGIDNLNQNWNGIWDVVVTQDSAGWSAEFRIPFRTLRFHRGGDLRFGFNVRRFIRRKNEQDLWRSWGRAEGLYQLLHEGELTELGALNRVRDVEAYPYVLTRATASEHDSAGAKIGDGSLGGKAGLDMKVPVTPTVTADLTASTDFAQVEVDQQVINLTRFPFFFPEKREFFLESSGLFDFGTPSRVQVFYSRRIGLDTAGAAVAVNRGGGGARRRRAWGNGVARVRISDRPRVHAAAGFRASHWNLGDDGPHQLHAPTPRARHPPARFQVHPRMGHHRQQHRIARPLGRLADRMV